MKHTDHHVLATTATASAAVVVMLMLALMISNRVSPASPSLTAAVSFSAQDLVPLQRYYDGWDHMALARSLTAAENSAGYTLEGQQGYVSSVIGTGLSPLYSCLQKGQHNHFTSLGQNCEGNGNTPVETIGYVWTSPADGLIPLYRCYRSNAAGQSDHFLSRVPTCDGGNGTLGNNGQPLFYVLAQKPASDASCTLTASPATITRGASITLSWSTNSAVSGSLNHDLGALSPIAAGSIMTTAATSTVFIATVASANGATAKCQTPVTVQAVAAGFTVGDFVKATDHVAVRASALLGSPRLVVEPLGTVGVVVGGPVTANNYVWWQVKWPDNTAGWSVQDYLAPSIDTLPPSVSIVTPAEGSIVKGVADLSATASDDHTVSRVTFIIDGTSVSKESTAPYRYNWDSSSIANGTYTLRVTARDAAGHASSATRRIVVSNQPAQPPTCTLSAVPNALLRGGETQLSWVSSGAATGAIDHNIGAMNPVAQGSASTTLTRTTTYTATVTGAGGKGTCSAVVTVSASVPAFSIGDTVQTTDRVAVRTASSLNGTRVGAEALGAVGTVVAGPITANNYVWWQIKWQNGLQGWSVQDYLKLGVPAPRNLATTNVTADSVGLSWAAPLNGSSVTGYTLERCLGAGCTSFAQVAAPAGTTYTDGGLASNSLYRYRVRASDAASNLSDPSNVIAVALTQTAKNTGLWMAPHHVGANGVVFQGFLPEVKDLFSNDAAWAQARAGVSVWKFYRVMLAGSDDTYLQTTVIPKLKEWNIQMAIETGGGSRCKGVQGDDVLVDRIQKLGGNVDYFVLDSPFWYELYTCHYTLEHVIQDITDYIVYMKSRFPNLKIGITDPIPLYQNNVVGLETDYRELVASVTAAGYKLDFIQADNPYDYSGFDTVRTLETYIKTVLHIDFGLIFNSATGGHTSNGAFYSDTLADITKYKSMGGAPDQMIVQSWYIFPNTSIPEDSQTDYPFAKLLIDFAKQAGITAAHQ